MNTPKLDMMKRALERNRSEFTGTDRRWDWRKRSWMTHRTWGAQQHRKIWKLKDKGELTWASVVMANNIRWVDTSDGGVPCGLIYSFDLFLQRNPWALQGIAKQLSLLRERKPSKAAQLATIARELKSSDYSDLLGLPVPKSISNGRVVYFSSVYLPCKHLPTGRLVERSLPIVVDRTPGGPAMVPPLHIWDRGLVARWEARDV